MTRPLRGLAVGAVAVIAALTGVVAEVGPAVASDAPPGSFEIDYDASGSSYLSSPKTTINLGPTVGQTFISDSGDGTFTGKLPLPPAATNFKILGLVSVSATANFIQVGQIAGHISDDVPTKLTASAKYTIRLTNVRAAGLPTFQGNSCQTTAPVTIPISTPSGQSFDLTDGGVLAGTYTIGKFANCGLTTGLINLLVPGKSNTVSLRLSNGRFVE